MARPTKHNADYFSHDIIMRDDPKIKALRRKYSHIGYSIWNMMLELLTSKEYFEYEWNELNIELLAPDFDIDAEELDEMVTYCIKIGLLQLTNGYLHCDKLTFRLEEGVLSKRKGYCRNNSKRNQLQVVNLELTPNNDSNYGINNVNDIINGQSKGKESKVNKNKVNESKGEESEVKETEVNEIRLADKLNDIKNRIHSGEFISFQLFQAELLEFNLSGSDEVNLWNSI
jgi:hypothetical protein